MKYFIIILSITFGSCAHRKMGEEFARKQVMESLSDTAQVSYKLPNGPAVHDRESAVDAVEHLLFEIYGEDQIKEERPYEIYNIDGYWIIEGTLRYGYDGGTFQIIFEAESRRIIRLTHYR